jgi:hypothetical protein
MITALGDDMPPDIRRAVEGAPELLPTQPARLTHEASRRRSEESARLMRRVDGQIDEKGRRSLVSPGPLATPSENLQRGLCREPG